jgi:hypothetical protein
MKKPNRSPLETIKKIGESKMREYRVYRPKKDRTGAASKVQFVVKTNKKYPEAMCFIEIAKETTQENDDNAQFDWRSDKNPSSKSITIKMGLVDIAEFLLCFRGDKESIKLFHQNKKGNISINLGKYQDKGYTLNVSSQIDGVVTKLGHMISHAESLILEVLFRDYIVKYHEV